MYIKIYHPYLSFRKKLVIVKFTGIYVFPPVVNSKTLYLEWINADFE